MARYSVVIETANLRSADPKRLIVSLDSIVEQAPLGGEFILLDSGDAPAEILQTIRDRHPSIRVHRIPDGTDYGDQKALTPGFAAGEMIVFADSDCVYLRPWLNAMLEGFETRPEIQVLAGETTIAITGPFTLAMALIYFFPRFSQDAEIGRARGFYGNNVAFRREVFTRCPFPSALAMHRTQNVVYSRRLWQAGIAIWRHPQARAFHAPPEGMGWALRRFFRTGCDMVRLGRAPAGARFQGDCEPYHREGGRARKLIERVRAIAKQQPRALLMLPLALPVVVACIAAFFIGSAFESVRPQPSASLDPQQ